MLKCIFMTQTPKNNRQSHNNSVLRGKKRVRVLACGTFDVLHLGHVHYLQRARKWGNELAVIVARDVNVEKNKGKKPLNDEKTRVEIIRSLKCVDKAVLGKHGNIFDKVEELRPNVLALGYDQKPDNETIARELKKRNIACQIVRISSFHPEKYKSSILKRRLKDREK